MRILTRYILREVTSHALLGGVLFTFVLFTTRLSPLLELVVRNSASFSDVVRLVAYFLPEALIVTIPMAVLVGILLGLSRLAADSEITAMRASGMGALDFVRIVSMVSLVALLLGLANSIFLAPQAADALLKLEDSLKYAQASFEVQPRVFDEDFRNMVLYVQDVRPGSGAALWRHVFLADVTEPANPRVTTAEEALVTSAGPGDLHMLMQDGGRHEISSTDPDQYNISTFTTTDLPIQNGTQDDTHYAHSDTHMLALPLHELMQRANPGNATIPKSQDTPAAREKLTRPYRIEFNRRFSYPFACLVLMLVGVPLGLSSKRGGKSTGFVLTILLVFLYYFVSSVGIALATQGKLSPFLGVWGANLIFAGAGALLLQQMSRGGVALSLFSTLGVMLGNLIASLRSRQTQRADTDLTMQLPQRLRSLLHIRFPLILDEYVMRAFGSNVVLVTAAFTMLYIIFTFFELIGDIIRNRTPLVTVGDYLLNLIPYILYNVTPLCVLVAVLVTFGGLARSSEFTAMKAAGFSLYRIITPVLILSAIIAVALFAFDDFYLPGANRRQEALRSVIKGKPAQTFLRPDRQWISGQSQTFSMPLADEVKPNGTTLAAAIGEAAALRARTSDPARIFYYQFFDADKDVFANLTVFEFDPTTFKLERRVFAQTAHWDPELSEWLFEHGWVRTFKGDSIAGYQPFDLKTFAEIHEQPQYFKKEARPSQEMNFTELDAYIKDLRQSGFDTKRLSVQLNRKFAYPLVTLVMAILAIPFALATGKRSGITGFAVAILLAVGYLGILSLFEAMGNVNTLPAALAEWSPDVLFTFAGAWFLLRTPT
jgi:LPS export ABC transporter permease LptF/LPS export ABC transporter permease LptG